MEYQSIIPIPNGYFLEKEHGFLSVIIPEKRTNYVLNPLLMNDIGATLPKNFGLAAVGTPVRISGGPFWYDYPRFTVVTNSLIAAIVTPTVKAGTFVASVWVKSINNNTSFKIRIRGKDFNNSSDVTITSNTFIASNEFKQYELTFTTSTQGIYNVMLDILIVTGTSIDIAGMQLEKGIYSTTFIHGFGGEGYSWSGPPYDGASTRTEEVICGGRRVNLRDLGFRITSSEGLGIPDNFDINSQPKAFGLGSIYTCRSIENRDISFSGIIYSKDLNSLLSQRNKLGYAVFDLNKIRCFEWTPYDCNKEMKCVKFLGLLESGMTFGYNTHHGEEIELSFVAPDVAIRACENTCQVLNTTPISFSNKLVAFKEDGSRSNIPNPSLASYTLVNVVDVKYSTYTKKLYAACSFIAGVTRRNVILEYDGLEWIPIILSSATFSALYVYGNYIFAGTVGNSNFSGQNGWVNTGSGLIMIGNLNRKHIINTSGIVSTANVLSASGVSVVPRVNTFASDGGTYVYFGGSFAASAGFEAHLGMINIRDSATGQPFREPHGVTGYATQRGGINALLYISEKRELWIGGDFNNNIATGVSNVAQTFMGYSFSRATQINKFGSGIFQYLQRIAGTSIPRPFGIVYALAYYRGRVIMGGDFDDSDTSSTLIPSPHRVNGIIYIDGDGLAKPFPSNWGFNASGSPRPVVYGMNVCDNILHIAGFFRNYGNVRRSDGVVQNLVVSRGAADFVASGYAENGFMKKAAPSVNTDLFNGVICTDNPEYSLIYFNSSNTTTTSDVHQPTTIKLCNNRLETPPIIYVRGPGTITSLTNYVNGTKVYFEYKFTTLGPVSGALASDEILMFDFTANPMTVTSSAFGDLSSLIQPSSLPITLEPGVNSILVDFASGSTTIHTKAWVCWEDSALSAEALQMECL